MIRNSEKKMFIFVFLFILVLSCYFPQVLDIWEKVLLIVMAIAYHWLRVDSKTREGYLSAHWVKEVPNRVDAVSGMTTNDSDDIVKNRIGFR